MNGDIPPPSAYIDATFGYGGYLSRGMPSYRPRDGQIAMARAVDEAVTKRSHLLCEAPTGIGKSLGYSVPASYYAATTGKRVIIVTANIALQEQIVGKDLPRLAEVVPWEFTYALMKGRSNYLCRSQYTKLILNGDGKQQAMFAADRARQATQDADRARLFQWARNEVETNGIGDVSGLTWQPPDKIWRDFSVPADECKGYRCAFKDTCGALRAQREAKQAQVVVTNYHLFFLNLRLYAERGVDLILPAFDVAIFDECFVAGTLVDGTPIEQIDVGDIVWSYDETTGRMVQRAVRRIFVSKPSALVRVTVGDRPIVCTPGHPFLTERGWVPAGSLRVGDLVLSTTDATYHDHDAVRGLQQTRERLWQGDERRETTRESLLLSGTREGRWSTPQCPGRTQVALAEEQSGSLSAHASEEPDARSEGESQGLYFLAGDGMEADGSWWQWKTAPASSTGACSSFGVAVRSSGPHGRQARQGSGTSQDRHRERSAEDRDRGGWGESQGVSSQNAGPSEGPVTSVARVDRVEVLEQGSDGRFGGLCPDGLVYNLEVEGTHTYLVNDLVVHNCHKAADIARDFFGWNIRESSPKRAARYFRDRHPTEVAAVEGATSWFFEQMKALRHDKNRYQARVVPAKLSQADVEAAANLVEALGKLEKFFAADRAALVAAGESDDKIITCEKAWEKTTKIRQGVESVVNPSDDNEVVFLEEDEFRNVNVACRLVRPGQVLRGALFEKTKNAFATTDDDRPDGEIVYGDKVSVVCTSATLATDSGFEFAASELGAPEGYAQLTVETPFNFESQALFIIPEKDLCDPNDDAFTGKVAHLFLRTISLARGRTLGLFTSRKRMNDVFEYVNGKTPFTILRQGDAPRTTLVERFRQDTHSVLLGVASFWAGVDVPGESLSCVFIDKIPFPTPDDPVLDRLRETDKRAFGVYAIPRAVIEFKQGFGRLIRSTSDRGVVVCCDMRLLTKGYGKQFLRSMPKMQKIKNLEAIRDWIDAPPPVEEEIDPFS